MQRRMAPLAQGEFQFSPTLDTITEMAGGRLFLGVTRSERTENIKSGVDALYFSIDDELVYMNYYMDFGPLNISCLYKYCVKVDAYMQCPSLRRIIHYTSCDPNKRVNGAYLIGSYCIISLNMEPKLVYRKLLDSGGPFRQFVDASQGISKYTLNLLECLEGVQRAMALNFFDFADFNVTEYDLYDKIQNGDFNWLVPRKFLALIGPIDKEISQSGHSPSFYIKYFLKNDVRTIIRLNNKLYDSYVFIKAGIDHFDLFFPDGTTPPKQVLLKFLQIAEKSPGAIAVHCKAGLGRTGSLIGAYIMKHYKFTAKEAIAWMRICRPGSVIGQQQGWLEKIEPWLWKQGTIFRIEQFGEGDKLPHHKYGIYSKAWQAQRKKILLLAHKRTQSEGPAALAAPSPLYRECEVYNVRQREAELQSIYRKIKQQHVQLSTPCETKRFKGKPDDVLTQGDKLNEIKIRKYLTVVEGTSGNQPKPQVDATGRRNVYREYLQYDKYKRGREQRYFSSER